MTKTRKRPEFISLPVLGQLALSGRRPLVGHSFRLSGWGGVDCTLTRESACCICGDVERGCRQSAVDCKCACPRLASAFSPVWGLRSASKPDCGTSGRKGTCTWGRLAPARLASLPLPLPPIVHITLAILAGALVAGAWGLLPAYLRAYRGVNEVVTTIMMNYVAQYFTSWMVHDPQPMAEPGAFFPMSRNLAPTARLADPDAWHQPAPWLHHRYCRLYPLLY